MSDETKPKLRLVKVELQAEFVLDDGETLAPAKFGPVAITPADWPAFDLQTAAEAAMRETEAISEQTPNGASGPPKPARKPRTRPRR